MLKKAIACTGVESIIDTDKMEDLSSEAFLENLTSSNADYQIQCVNEAAEATDQRLRKNKQD